MLFILTANSNDGKFYDGKVRCPRDVMSDKLIGNTLLLFYLFHELVRFSVDNISIQLKNLTRMFETSI